MSQLHALQIKALTAKTLRRMGAKQYTLLRVPKDLNGQPAGEAEEIGQIFGLSYMDAGIRNRVHIALPGVVSSGDAPTLACVLLSGNLPEPGDLITRCGKQTTALSAAVSGPLIIITTKELIP